MEVEWFWNPWMTDNIWNCMALKCVVVEFVASRCLIRYYTVCPHFVATTRLNLLTSLSTNGFVEPRFLMQPLFFRIGSINMLTPQKDRHKESCEEAGRQSKHWSWLGVQKDQSCLHDEHVFVWWGFPHGKPFFLYLGSNPCQMVFVRVQRDHLTYCILHQRGS